VAFSPDGKWLATASYDGTIRLRDPDDGRTVRTVTGHDDWVFTVAFSGDGQTLASGSGDGTIRLWEVATGTEEQRLVKQHTVSRVAFSSGDDLLASTAAEGNIGLWDPADGELLALLRVPSRSSRN
jgi:WD40 repeat protein